MKKKKLKKLFIILPICVVVIVGIVIGVVIARKNSQRAYVVPVSDISDPWVISVSSFSGTVAQSAQDNIMASSDDTVTEVFVKEGDTVKKGDKLFQYDTVGLQIKVEEKKISAEYRQTLLERQQALLETYREIVPYVPEETQEVQDETAAQDDANAPVSDENAEDIQQDDAAAEAETEKQYTAQEKEDLITSQELEVSKAQTELDKANEELREAKENLDNAIVYAKIDGTVSKIGTPGVSESASSPFCTIIGTTGVTVKGYVGEFDLKTIKVGDTLGVSSMMTVQNSQAEIISINDYPVDSTGGFYPSGNPNSSYYEFTAYIEESEGFDIGEDVQITKVTENIEDMIVLDQIYILSDSDGSYVLIDEDGKLKRQNVSIEKTSQIPYVIVTEGLSSDDLIAFPHGTLAKEGLLTTTEQKTGLF